MVVMKSEQVEEELPVGEDLAVLLRPRECGSRLCCQTADSFTKKRM